MLIEPIKLNNIPEAECNVLNLEDFKINPDEDIPEPIPILHTWDERGNLLPIFTEDNISMIQGKAKSRKSTFIRAISTAVMGGKFGVLECTYRRNRMAIFDTEQGAYHCSRAVRQIKQLSGRNVDYYKLAGLPVASKKYLVETHLKQNPDCGFVILDNIVHFLLDFNSSTESSELNEWLIKLKGEYNTHICVVLHENGSDIGNGKAKGHIGTLLENTCETIIRVEKDKDDKGQSIISPKAMRGLEFNPILMQVDYQGVPYLSWYEETDKPKKMRL